MRAMRPSLLRCRRMPRSSSTTSGTGFPPAPPSDLDSGRSRSAVDSIADGMPPRYRFQSHDKPRSSVTQDRTREPPSRWERLTQTGAGTPMGGRLRRYWWPIAGASEFDQPGTKPVRLLGEDLVLYKDLGGRWGLIDRHCRHRRADLSYGYVEARGVALQLPRLAL